MQEAIEERYTKKVKKTRRPTECACHPLKGGTFGEYAGCGPECAVCKLNVPGVRMYDLLLGGWPAPPQSTQAMDNDDATVDPQREARVGHTVAIEHRAATMEEGAWVVEKYRVGWCSSVVEARAPIRAISPPPSVRPYPSEDEE
ncbi:hypothetical protein B0H13DRAFT_1922284 [Mycena leptocephala]|nr:hypothetical protein B0H13DRAFT_1922284 [Mycena leptocephala]